MRIFTVRKRSLGQGNIFTSVCQEFYSKETGMGPGPRGPCSGGSIWSRGGACSGGACLAGFQAHCQGGSLGVSDWGGGSPGPHTRGKLMGDLV